MRDFTNWRRYGGCRESSVSEAKNAPPGRGGGLASGAEKHREGRAETPLASVARRSSAAPWGRGRDGDRGRLLLEACLRSRV